MATGREEYTFIDLREALVVCGVVVKAEYCSSPAVASLKCQWNGEQCSVMCNYCESRKGGQGG